MNKPEVFKKPTALVMTPEQRGEIKSRDIIVKKITTETDYDDFGNEIKKRKVTKVNITKKINETKKLIKNDQALKKLEELEKIFNE